MSRTKYLEGPAWVKGEQAEWFPKIRLLLAFVLGLLALSSAILGRYWEMLLPK